jgi:tetratricopeptide (TPR) repeat protein
LLARARSIAPQSAPVLNNYLYWLVNVGRCDEVIPLAEQAIATSPTGVRRMTGVYNELAVCKTWTGHAEEDIALQQTADRLNPLSPWKFSRYRHIAWASFLLGRDQDAIAYMLQAFAIKPDVDDGTQFYLRVLAAAYARTGDLDRARRYLAQADRLSPYDTVRGHFPDDLTSPVYVEQIRQFQNALRLAGERDHADEDADFGVPPDNVLHGEAVGKTPMQAPGATTIHTGDLVKLLAESRPLVIDVASHFWGRSLPGAVGLRLAGAGGSFTDSVQDRLRSRMHGTTGGNLALPIVALGWNVEEFYGRNLALRLVAMGYTRVFWYRGGREAWEVHGLPEAPLDVQEW